MTVTGPSVPLDAVIEDIEKTFDRFLTHGQTITPVVVSTPVPPRTLPITG